MKIGSLFSGAGALDLAVLEIFPGATVAWHAENDRAAAKVLAYRFPGVPNLDDVEQIDWATVEPVDVLIGGSPCTDLSSAGRRAGMMEGTRSGLWHRMADAIRMLRPRFVLFENVSGIFTSWGEPPSPEYFAAADALAHIDRVLETIDRRHHKAVRNGWTEHARRKQHERHRILRRRKPAVGRLERAERLVQRAVATVLGSLAALGYVAEWTCLRASAVGACHIRERFFLLAADPADPQGDRPSRLDGGPLGTASRRGRERQPGGDAGSAPVPVALLPTPTSRDHKGRANKPGRTRAGRERTAGDDTLPDAVGKLLPTPSAADGLGGHLTRSGSRSGELLLPGLLRAVGEGTLLSTPDTTTDLLPTPTARLGHPNGRGASDPARRKELQPKRAGELDEMCVHEFRTLPTPRTTDANGAGSHGVGGDDLRTAVVEWGSYGAAIRRQESVTRPAPSPTEPNTRGKPRLAAEFASWMMMWPENWVTAPEIGLSRTEQLRIIGNGVVPLCAAVAFWHLLDLLDDPGVAA